MCISTHQCQKASIVWWNLNGKMYQRQNKIFMPQKQEVQEFISFLRTAIAIKKECAVKDMEFALRTSPMANAWDSQKMRCPSHCLDLKMMNSGHFHDLSQTSTFFWGYSMIQHSRNSSTFDAPRMIAWRSKLLWERERKCWWNYSLGDLIRMTHIATSHGLNTWMSLFAVSLTPDLRKAHCRLQSYEPVVKLQLQKCQEVLSRART